MDEYGSFVPYCDPAIRGQFQADINECVTWLYEAGENAPLCDYESRVAKFREIGEAIRRRYRYYEALPDTKLAYEKCCARIEQRMATMTELTLLDESRQTVHAKCKVASDFWTTFQSDLAA